MIMDFYCCKMTLKKWNIKIFFLYYHSILRTFEQKIKSIKQSYLRIISDMISKIFALVRSQFETELFTVHFETRTSCLLLRECHTMVIWIIKFPREGLGSLGKMCKNQISLRLTTCALTGFFWLLSHVIYLKLTRVS